MIELIWRIVPDADKYEASSEGQVRSRVTGKILKPRLNPKGYLWLMIYPNRQHRSVASMIAAAFIGPRPEGYHVAHSDGNKLNNHLSNLAYKTATENEHDKILHGRKVIGERHGRSRLTEDQVEYIRLNCVPGDLKTGFRAIGKELGVSMKTIRLVYRGDTWGHVETRAIRALPVE